MQPISRPVSIKLVYENVSITPRFKTQAGSFSEFKKNPNSANWELRLGDGEDVLFYLDIDKENADVSNISIAYESSGANKTIHNARGDDKDTKFDINTFKIISSSSSGGNVKEGGYIEAGWDVQRDPETGQRLYRVRHANDERKDGYYAVTKDLFYRNLREERLGDGTAAGLAGANYSFRYLDPPPYTDSGNGLIPDHSYNTISAAAFIENWEGVQGDVDLRSASGNSIVPVLAGSSAVVSVSLSGNYSMEDLLSLREIQWDSSNPALIAAAGSRGPDFAVLVPGGSGPKKTLLTASLGSESFSFLVLSADTPEELASMKAFHCPKTALSLIAGETARIDIEHFGYTQQEIESLRLQTSLSQSNPNDVYWFYDSSNGIVNLIFDQNNPLSAAVSALSPGSYGFAVSRWNWDRDDHSNIYNLMEICNVNATVTGFPVVWSVSPPNQNTVSVEYLPDGSVAILPLGQGTVILTASVPNLRLSTAVLISSNISPIFLTAKTVFASVSYGSNSEGAVLVCSCL